jgi:hypothetical protein
MATMETLTFAWSYGLQESRKACFLIGTLTWPKTGSGCQLLQIFGKVSKKWSSMYSHLIPVIWENE